MKVYITFKILTILFFKMHKNSSCHMNYIKTIAYSGKRAGVNKCK
jgi:hypothetical protein